MYTRLLVTEHRIRGSKAGRSFHIDFNSQSMTEIKLNLRSLVFTLSETQFTDANMLVPEKYPDLINLYSFVRQYYFL